MTRRPTPGELTASAPELRNVVADWLGEAAMFRRRGETSVAITLEQCAADVSAVADDFTTWLSEADAARRSGWSGDQIRRHARKFLHTPHVIFEKRAYRLRACIVPRRAHHEMIREAAHQGAA